jgi:2-polyprenyl-6-methoxyphenol hydroxylase-like FAD-dependent oxidoreductase
VDLPQTRLEPILVRYATLHGFKCRFDTEFVSSTEDKETGRILVSLKDKLNGVEFQIRCRYLFGADGARSRIATQVDLPLAQKPDKGIAYNVLVRVDMAHLMDARMGNLHWIMQPDKEHPDWAWICVVRMVKPWDEWMFVVFPDRKAAWEDHKPTNEQWLARIKEFIGDSSIPAEIIGVSKWRINDTVADQYSKGNV